MYHHFGRERNKPVSNVRKRWKQRNGNKSRVGGKGKTECAVDCNKAPGSSGHSWASAYGLPGLLSGTPYRCVTGHGNDRFLLLESPVNGTCIE